MELALERPGVFAKFEHAMVAKIEEQITEWSQYERVLHDWEDRNLLGAEPTPDKLSLHKEIIGEVIFYGQLFSLACSHPNFPRHDLSEQVQAIMWSLRDRHQMFHNRMSDEEANAILAKVFPDEPRP